MANGKIQIDTELLFAEVRKLIFFVLLGALAGVIFGSYQTGIIVVLLIYAGLLLYTALRYQKSLKNLDFKNLPYHGKLVNSISDDIHRILKKHSKLNKRLARQIQSQKTMLDTWPDAMVVVDDQFVVYQFNINAQTWLGLKDEDKGRHITNLIREQGFSQYLKTKLKELKSQEAQEQVSEDVADGSDPYSDNAVKFESPKNSTQILQARMVHFIDDMYLIVLRDMTVQDNVERMRKDFIANVSHELKTPLTAIKGFAEMLEEEVQGSEAGDYVSHILEQSNRLDSIVNDLLKLSKLESSRPPSFVNSVDIAEIIEDEVNLMRQIHPDYYYQIQTDKEIKLLGQASEIKSLVSNLIVNAVNHNKPGIDINIHWGMSEDGQNAYFCVCDNGIGVDSKDAALVTERFFRADGGREYKKGKTGTGLGLAIVKHVIQRHHGKLEINSEINEGMEVICTFPADKVIRKKTDKLDISAEDIPEKLYHNKTVN